MFTFFDDKGLARHPLVISSKIYSRVANLLYWKGHCPPIVSISGLFFDITKHKQVKHFCFCCLCHFTTSDILARHQQLCTRDDFMSVLHLLPVPGTERAQINFNQFKNTTKAPFVIFVDFESNFDPLNRKVQHTTMIQHHKVCGAAAILCSKLPDFNLRTMMKVGPRALSEFLVELSKWESEIIEVLMQNLKMNRLNVHYQVVSDNSTRYYMCRHDFIENETKGLKVRDHDHITGDLLGAAHRTCNLERPVSFKIPVFVNNFGKYDSHLIVHELKTRPDREIKVIGQNMD